MQALNNMIRGVVSGERNRFQQDGYDLDLTYITPRIIAMSFPASGTVQKLYRNNIVDVSEFLKQRHGSNYKVYNMSGTPYDTTPFNDQVLTAQWEDHHSPTLLLLA